MTIEQHSGTIGRTALYLVLSRGPAEERLLEAARDIGYRVVLGQVGSMDMQKVIAAIETAARRERLVSSQYPEDHALYHAILDALHGIGRGQIALGSILRTAGLRFTVVRGPQFAAKAGSPAKPDDPLAREWLAVALYGQIGGPIKGNEHECVGLGINHV